MGRVAHATATGVSSTLRTRVLCSAQKSTSRSDEEIQALGQGLANFINRTNETMVAEHAERQAELTSVNNTVHLVRPPKITRTPCSPTSTALYYYIDSAPIAFEQYYCHHAVKRRRWYRGRRWYLQRGCRPPFFAVERLPVYS